MVDQESMLFNKIYGCLTGGIIGDAMGAPVECKTYQEIEKEFGWVEDFNGSGTDDSAIKMVLCDAIISNGGYITADEFADSFLGIGKKYFNMFYIPVKSMVYKVENKLSLPVYAGLGNMQSSSSAMAISPMGIINACNPRQAALETYDVAGLIHAGDTTFCRDGACAIAAAVAEAMKPEATVQSVLEAGTAYLHKTSSIVMKTLLKDILEMAKTQNDYKKFREKFYASKLQNVMCDSRETVPCVFALFHLADGDPVKSITYAANFGRDTDTIATMIGAIAGAFKGVEGLKKEWVEKVEINNPGQKELAEKITEVVYKRMEDTAACLGMLSVLSQQR
ncbi:MAG: ADP-ribosylglycohydrolase family protein [Clostridiales bacterium]|nr:ADP-ribosylglycohydrolase family protein [Clostridiales bacterium]